MSTAQAQKVGINTTTPGSTLTVNGSISIPYTTKTSDYTLGSTDYHVVFFTQKAQLTCYLPAAQGGADNFRGRLYRIKNNTLAPLYIVAAGSETIGVNQNRTRRFSISPNNTVELVSTGATSGMTWDMLSNTGTNSFTDDGVRYTLLRGGCASCAAYDAASPGSWVAVTRDEYDYIRTMDGMQAYGATDAQMRVSSGTTFGGSFTSTLNFNKQSVIPANNYVFAFSVRVPRLTAATNMQGFRLKVSTTSQTSGYNEWAYINSTPVVNDGTYYFVLRSFTRFTGPTSANIGFSTNFSGQITGINESAVRYFGPGDISNPSNLATLGTPLLQVLGSPSRP